MERQIVMDAERFSSIIDREARSTGCHEHYVKGVKGAVFRELLLDEVKPLFGSGWYPSPEVRVPLYSDNVEIKVPRAKRINALRDYTKILRRLDYARVKGDVDLTVSTPEWVFRRKDWPSIILRMDFSKNDAKDETICRFVQVGVKEVPDMKLVCPGEPVLEAVEGPASVPEDSETASEAPAEEEVLF